MAFVQSGRGSRTYIKLAEQSDGDVLVEGYYVGDEEGKYGKSYIFRQQADDSVVGFNQTGKLTKWIEENVVTGDLVKIVYRGKQTMESGKFAGKPVHDFDFYIDSGEPEKATPVTKPAIAKPSAKAEKFNKFADEAL